MRYYWRRRMRLKSPLFLFWVIKLRTHQKLTLNETASGNISFLNVEMEFCIPCDRIIKPS